MTVTIEPRPTASPHAPPDGGLYDSPMARERLASAQDVRDNFAAVIRDVSAGEEYVVVVRRSRPTVGVVPMWMVERMKELGITSEKPPATT